MGIEIIFIIWLLVIIVIFFLARNYGITWWSSLVLALFFGLLVLACAICLPTDDLFGKDCDDESSSDRDRKSKKNGLKAGQAILCLLALISLIVIIIYIIQKTFSNTCESICDMSEATKMATARE